jgi:hypothetical protein
VRADGPETDSAPRRTCALETAAKECGVSPATARAYKRVQDSGIDDVRLAVRQRQLSIEAGAKIAALPAADQADALAVAIAAASAAKASRKTWRRERRQRAFAPGLAAATAAPVRAGLVPALPPAALPPPTDLHALPPTSQVGDGEPLAGRLPVPPSLPPPVRAALFAAPLQPPAPTIGHAAACEAMCRDFSERLRRHLVMAKADHLPAPELDRCGAAVRALHLEVLRYLCLLNGASHPALLTDESLHRLADKKLAEFAAANPGAIPDGWRQLQIGEITLAGDWLYHNAPTVCWKPLTPTNHGKTVQPTWRPVIRPPTDTQQNPQNPNVPAVARQSPEAAGSAEKELRR